MSGINIQPLLTTNAQGSFQTSAEGLMQGVAMDDPAVRNQLAGGILAAAALLPMFGGVGITEKIVSLSTNSGAHRALGGDIDRALLLTGASALTGFSVFNQNHAAINTPNSPVPQTPQGGLVNFYRLGSLARIALKIDPALVSLDGTIITSQVSWDFANQMIIPFQAAHNAIAITSQTWAAGIVTVVTGAAHPFAVGDDVTITGAAPDAYNGQKKLLTTVDNTHFTYAMPVDPGTSPAGTPGTISAGGGALPVKILKIEVGNSMVVNYDPVSGNATWDRAGSCALVQI